MRIRLMTEADLDRVDEMERLYFSVPWTRQDFQTFLRRDDTVFLVAEERPAPCAGQLLGYAGAMVIAGDADILNIAVDEKVRRTGCGKALLSGLLDGCRALGAVQVFLEVRESNEAAIGLYGSFGFSGIGRRRNYYTRPDEDAVLMRLVYGEAVRESGPEPAESRGYRYT